MRFVVERTSQSDEDEPPCKEAVRGEIMSVDERTVNDPAKLTAYGSPDEARAVWYGSGSNHRVEGGHIKRDMGMVPAWFVELEDLTALVEFQEKYGSLVLEWSWRDKQSLQIEIYDTYRE